MDNKNIKLICPNCKHERFMVIELSQSINVYEITKDSDSLHSKKKKDISTEYVETR